MRTTLAWLRFWGMANASKKMGIHTHPAVVKIELGLQQDFTKAYRTEKLAHVN